jgi:ABC-type nitrate/sulfonate/bicarbonate transport system permease component
MFAGWLAACSPAIALGAAIASSSLARRLLATEAEFLRPLPASAILPIAILVLGLSDAMIVFVVAFGCGLAGAARRRSTAFGRSTAAGRGRPHAALSRWQRAWTFQLPAALPDIFAGMRVSIAIALIVTVASEMLSSQPASAT